MPHRQEQDPLGAESHRYGKIQGNTPLPAIYSRRNGNSLEDAMICSAAHKIRSARGSALHNIPDLDANADADAECECE